MSNCAFSNLIKGNIAGLLKKVAITYKSGRATN